MVCTFVGDVLIHMQEQSRANLACFWGARCLSLGPVEGLYVFQLPEIISNV